MIHFLWQKEDFLLLLFRIHEVDTDSDPRIYPLDYGSSPKTVEIKVYLTFSAC